MAFGENLYRKRFLLTVIADQDDDWAAYVADGLGSQNCFWDIEEIESVNLLPESEKDFLERLEHDGLAGADDRDDDEPTTP